jgi:hypothetical protein
MANRFVSFLEKVGKDFLKGLNFIMPYAETAGEVAVGIFAPGLGPLFNQTVNAVITAEQAAAAVGKQSGTGVQKLASVVQLMGPLIAQGLSDAGMQNDEAAVQAYINSIVTILNSIPAPAGTPAAAPAPVAAAPAAAETVAAPTAEESGG